MTFDDILQDTADRMPQGDDTDADPGSGLGPSEEEAEPSSTPSDPTEPPASPQPPFCENCRTPLLGSFCHQCGQSDRSLDLNLGAFAREWLGSVFGFDGRVWRTLALLLRRPGRLSHEYLQGRRASYVSPLRLYFFISLAAFLILTATDTPLMNASDGGIDGSGISLNVEGTDLEDKLTAVRELQPEPDSATPSEFSPAPEDLDSPAEAAEAAPEEETGGFETAAEKVAEKAIETAVNDNEKLSKEFARNLPKAVFFLVPFYALLLKLFFRRRYRSFLQHLVVSLHLHATAFVLITLGHLVDVIAALGKPESDLGQSMAGLILLIHTFMALRRVYGDRRRVLLAKYAVLSMAHITALGLVMMINLFFAFYRMGAFD